MDEITCKDGDCAMKPRISVADWCFFQKTSDPAVYYEKVREAGCVAVEMAAPERWPVARAAGLQLLNISGPGMKVGLNRTENHAPLMADMGRAIEQAAANQIRQVIFFSGNSLGQDKAEGLKNCIRATKAMAKTAEEAGVTLVFEMLNSFDHADYQADRSAYGFELVKAVNSPCVKVLYDVYHMHRMGEDVGKDILANLPLIAHIHVAGNPGRNYPGQDQKIDYRRLVGAVQRAGYQGCWGMEFLPGPRGIEELCDAVTLFEEYA